jgi:hypothetical protein
MHPLEETRQNCTYLQVGPELRLKMPEHYLTVQEGGRFRLPFGLPKGTLFGPPPTSTIVAMFSAQPATLRSADSFESFKAIDDVRLYIAPPLANNHTQGIGDALWRLISPRKKTSLILPSFYDTAHQKFLS